MMEIKKGQNKLVSKLFNVFYSYIKKKEVIICLQEYVIVNKVIIIKERF